MASAVVEKVKGALGAGGGEKIPEDVQARLKRGRKRLDEFKPSRRVNIEFTENNHYCYTSEDGKEFKKQGVVSSVLGGQKPDHRIRRSRDLLGPIVQAKVSATTQRVPAFEVIPTTNDPEDFSAAKISEKVATAGYEKWRMRKRTQELVWNALVTEEAFIMAFWDSNVGPYIDVSQHPDNPNEPDPDRPDVVGMGEVGIQVWSGEEVTWEPGVEFEDSPWWAVEHARSRDLVEAEPGFEGPKLKPDASTAGARDKDAQNSNLVLVTEYFERPCPKYPNGRRLYFANGRQVFEADDYPMVNAKGEVVDEPCIHRLTYTVGSTERGKGLVCSLIESMREYDHNKNKMAEWIQLTMVPQVIAPKGSIDPNRPRTDKPGDIVEYDLAFEKPDWATPGNMPQELIVAQDRAKQELGEIAHVGEIPSQIRSAQGVATIYEKESSAWADFVMNLAETLSRTMRDCLTLVQANYTDDRLVKFRGRLGWSNIEDFRGSDLRGQTDVRVNPGSIEQQSRKAIEEQILNLVKLYPREFAPETVVSAIVNGNADSLIEGYEDDVAGANFVISQIRAGTFEQLPDRPVWPGEDGYQMNPETNQPERGEDGEPVMLTTVPGWMPRPYVDNVAVWKMVFANWMKSDEWRGLDADAKQATMIVFQALLTAEERMAQRAGELRQSEAERQGMMNAAKPQPDQPAPSPEAPAPPE